MYAGVADRMQKEITALAPSTIKIKIIAPPGLVVLLLGDPHGLEGGQRGQDGTTDPYGVFALGRSNGLDLDGGGSQTRYFSRHAVSNTSVHGGTTGHDNVGEQVLPDVNVTPHDASMKSFVNASRLHTKE